MTHWSHVPWHYVMKTEFVHQTAILIHPLQSLRSGRISNFSYNLSRAASCTSLDFRPDSARSVSRSLVSQMSLRRSATNLGDLTPGPGINPPEYVISSIASHIVRDWKKLRKEFKVCVMNFMSNSECYRVLEIHSFSIAGLNF